MILERLHVTGVTVSGPDLNALIRVAEIVHDEMDRLDGVSKATITVSTEQLRSFLQAIISIKERLE